MNKVLRVFAILAIVGLLGVAGVIVGEISSSEASDENHEGFFSSNIKFVSADPDVPPLPPEFE